jgi:hypothetical protein
VQRLEREVLELPLQLVDAEAVRERRVDLERLLRLLDLFLLAEVLDLAQVVQPVRELDEDHADVFRHRDDHLPVVLRLRLLARLELHARQLRDPVDELRDLVAELGAHLLELDARVLDDVVEQRGRDRLLVHAQPGEDQRDAVRMVDEVLPRTPLLPVVRLRRKQEGPRQQVLVDSGVVGLDLGDQLVDEALIPLVKLEDRHGFSVLPACFRSCPGAEGDRFSGRASAALPPTLPARGRKAPTGGENRIPMLKRWREKRKLIELAKLWAALDSAAPR